MTKNLLYTLRLYMPIYLYRVVLLTQQNHTKIVYNNLILLF